MKKCTKCGEEKEECRFQFKKDRKGFHNVCKDCMYELQKQRWIDRKLKLIQMFGGKCQKCGYDKNYAALEFHHLDPNEKEFQWPKLRLRKWETIIKELKKCVLLCANCHREEHWPDAILDFSNLNDNNFLNKSEIKPTGECPQCGIDVYGTKYCSLDCSTKANRKVKDRPTKKQLEKMLETMSWCAIARKYNVSDNAVRKWAKKYQIL